MGQYVICIHGTGQHHNFKTKPLAEGDPNPYGHPLGTEVVVGQDPKDADVLAQAFVLLLASKGHTITAATVTTGGEQSLIPAAPEGHNG